MSDTQLNYLYVLWFDIHNHQYNPQDITSVSKIYTNFFKFMKYKKGHVVCFVDKNTRELLDMSEYASKNDTVKIYNTNQVNNTNTPCIEALSYASQQQPSDIYIWVDLSKLHYYEYNVHDHKDTFSHYPRDKITVCCDRNNSLVDYVVVVPSDTLRPLQTHFNTTHTLTNITYPELYNVLNTYNFVNYMYAMQCDFGLTQVEEAIPNWVKVAFAPGQADTVSKEIYEFFHILKANWFHVIHSMIESGTMLMYTMYHFIQAFVIYRELMYSLRSMQGTNKPFRYYIIDTNNYNIKLSAALFQKQFCNTFGTTIHMIYTKNTSIYLERHFGIFAEDDLTKRIQNSTDIIDIMYTDTLDTFKYNIGVQRLLCPYDIAAVIYNQNASAIRMDQCISDSFIHRLSTHHEYMVQKLQTLSFTFQNTSQNTCSSHVRPLFIVSSYIRNAMYTYFDEPTRINQTLETVRQLRTMFPNSTIIIGEGSRFKWFPLDKHVENVHVLHHASSLEGIHKSEGEAHIMKYVLESDLVARLISEGSIDRIFKMSGRYKLTTKFDIKKHYTNHKDKIVCGPRGRVHGTDIYNTNTVIYSFDMSQVSYMIDRMKYIISVGCKERVHEELIFGEHVEHLDPQRFTELDTLHVYGFIGVCGTFWYY